jgi:hypothetical protein
MRFVKLSCLSSPPDPILVGSSSTSAAAVVAYCQALYGAQYPLSDAETKQIMEEIEVLGVDGLSDPIAARSAVAAILGNHGLYLPQVEILQQATTLTVDPVEISRLRLDISKGFTDLGYLRDAERLQVSIINQLIPRLVIHIFQPIDWRTKCEKST